MTSNLSTYHIANCNYNTVPLFLLKTAVWAETSREICVFTSVTIPPLVQSLSLYIYLKRNKDRKFYNLKYHQKNPRQNDNYPPQHQGKSNNQDTIATNQTPFSYASAVRRNPSNTNVRHDRNKNPLRKNSYTKLTNEPTQPVT